MDLYPPQLCLHRGMNLSDPSTMWLQVTLTLICVLFSQALALKCYECVPGASGTCIDTQRVCPDLCGSATTVVSAGDQQQQVSLKSCAPARECVTGTFNIGSFKMSVNSECCSTELCNTQTLAALLFGSPNGKQCYTCTGNDCTGIVSCEGDQDRCISATASSAGVQLAIKGCASKSFCTGQGSSMQAAGITEIVSCCSGNLCNAAAGINLSLLLPLLSSILFIL